MAKLLERKQKPSQMIYELDIEEIARIENVVGSDQGFIAAHNLDSPTYLSHEHINSLGNFKVGSPMKLRFTMMLFCVAGEMEVQLNLMNYTLHSGEMLVVNEGTVTMILRMNPAIRLVVMGFTRSYVMSLPPSRLWNMFPDNLFENKLIGLKEAEMSEILSVCRVISVRLANPDCKLKREMVWSGLQLIGCVLLDAMNAAVSSERELGRKKSIAKEFMHLVGKYACTQRNVSFYAQKLCISTKYLGQVISEITGDSPRKWICRQVVLEAKALLEDPSLTVQQVSEALNFANQSFFGTFFRQHTGLSPRDYRCRRPEEGKDQESDSPES